MVLKGGEKVVRIGRNFLPVDGNLPPRARSSFGLAPDYEKNISQLDLETSSLITDDMLAWEACCLLWTVAVAETFCGWGVGVVDCPTFLSDPGKPGVRSMGPHVTPSVRDLFADLTDVTLADEDSNSIPTDNANRAIQGNVAMQVMQPGGQLCKHCKWCHLMTKL